MYLRACRSLYHQHGHRDAENVEVELRLMGEEAREGIRAMVVQAIYLVFS